MQLRLVTLPLLILVASPVIADVEISAMVGTRTGSADIYTNIVCIAEITSPCPTFAKNDDGSSIGLIADFSLNDRWMLELLLNRHEADLVIDQIICPACAVVPLVGELEIDTVHIGAQRRWRIGKAHPFVAAGVGMSRVSNPITEHGVLNFDDDRPSASLGAGIQVPMSDHLGLRFEARGYWIDFSNDSAGFLEDLVQAEAGAGLTFSW